ncbi:MAG: hypothetical protein QM731_06935 [Chitinophagaceae bacterium]
MHEAEITSEDLLAAILSDKFALAAARLRQVQSITSEILMVPEIDIPRKEACDCYVIGANTACITLTSHLLERYCKELLIQVDFGPSFMRLNFQFDGTSPSDLSVYLNKDLSQTLAACKSKSLLSKEMWKVLDNYREIFRNGFSHYDPARILKGLTYKVSITNNPDEPIEEREFKLHDIPNVAFAVEVFAEKNAWKYLVTVENFIRSTIRYFHNPDIDPGLPVVS